MNNFVIEAKLIAHCERVRKVEGKDVITHQAAYVRIPDSRFGKMNADGTSPCLETIAVNWPDEKWKKLSKSSVMAFLVDSYSINGFEKVIARQYISDGVFCPIKAEDTTS